MDPERCWGTRDYFPGCYGFLTELVSPEVQVYESGGCGVRYVSVGCGAWVSGLSLAAVEHRALTPFCWVLFVMTLAKSLVVVCN